MQNHPPIQASQESTASIGSKSGAGGRGAGGRGAGGRGAGGYGKLPPAIYCSTLALVVRMGRTGCIVPGVLRSVAVVVEGAGRDAGPHSPTIFIAQLEGVW